MIDETIEVVDRTRERVRELLNFVDELFPEDASLEPRTTEYRMYSEDRGE